MYGTLTARLLRTGLALLLCATMAGMAFAGAFVPATAQDTDSTQLPGFDPLPAEAELLAFASGQFEGQGIATLLVERLTIESGAALDLVAGPFTVIVEQGSLTYEDDLGLEAELPAGESQFFAPGEGDSISNGSDDVTVVLRTSLITDAPINGAPGPEDGGDTDDETGDDAETDTGDDTAPDDTGDSSDEEDPGPGEDTPINPRDDDEEAGSTAPSAGGVQALILQETTAPDEVVISLTGDGFTPDTVELARGGVLVIENAGETSCEFRITDLDLQVELDAGDIEQVTIDGPAGDYDFTCDDAGDDVLGEGVLTILDESATDEPIEDATPEPDIAATPTPDDTTTDTGEGTESGPTGVLLQAAVTLNGASGLFTASIILQPGGALTLNGADGSLGLIVAGGDLTVIRPGRAAAVLRDGRSVTLPSGTAAAMSNSGDAALTILIAGVTGSAAAPAPEETATPESEDPGEDEPETDDSITPESGDGSLGQYAFFPDDSELAALGLMPTWVAFTEVSDPASNTFWITNPDDAESSFSEWNWLRSSEIRYNSGGEETEFGEVTAFGILVDSFEDDAGAADFYDYIATDPTGEFPDFLDGIEDVENAIGFTFSGTDSTTMFVAIKTGTYVVTLFAAGPGLDCEALIAQVSNLIFGVVG